jgi:hypothetical protein
MLVPVDIDASGMDGSMAGSYTTLGNVEGSIGRSKLSGLG